MEICYYEEGSRTELFINSYDRHRLKTTTHSKQKKIMNGYRLWLMAVLKHV